MARLIVTDKAGSVVDPGSTVTSFRGEPATLVRATRAAGVGYSGKVLVEWQPAGGRMEYYDRVFDLAVAELAPIIDLEAEHLEPLRAPFTSWAVPAGFVTFDVVQRIGDVEHRHGPAHVYDDGVDAVIVRAGNRELYSHGGFYMSIESDPSKPGQHFAVVEAALAEARRWVLERRQARRVDPAAEQAIARDAAGLAPRDSVSYGR